MIDVKIFLVRNDDPITFKIITDFLMKAWRFFIFWSEKMTWKLLVRILDLIKNDHRLLRYVVGNFILFRYNEKGKNILNL